MKVLLYRPGNAPAQTAFEAQVKVYAYLRKMYGWEFLLVVNEADTYRSEEFEMVQLPSSKTRNSILQKFSNKPPLALVKLLEKFRPSLIQTTDPSISKVGRDALFAALKSGVPVIFGTSITLTQSSLTPLRSRLLRFQLRNLAKLKCHGIVATVPKCLERLQVIGLYPKPFSKNVLILGHPVDPDLFFPRTSSEQGDSKKILVVSRLVPEKGIAYILEAVLPLLKKFPNWHLHFVGRGPMKSYILNECKRENLSDSVEITENVPYEEIGEMLRASEIFINHAVSTSRWEEYFGIANLEAMACGLPVVVSNCGGIPWVIREKEATAMVGERDVMTLKERIEELVLDRSKRVSMGAKAVKYVAANYALPVVAEKYRNFVEELVEKCGRD